MRLIARDLYRLRRACCLAERASLRAQMAQQVLKEITLELERKYGLLARDAIVDIQTGVIRESPGEEKDGPGRDADPGP